MHDAKRMERKDPEAHLRENLQDDFFLEHLVFLPHVLDPLTQVSAIRVLQNQAQVLRRLIYESSLV